jgi:hypothetical protein
MGQLRLSDGALEIIARGPLVRWLASKSGGIQPEGPRLGG